MYKYASDKEVPLLYVSHMEVPIIYQLESGRAFQAARHLHDYLLSNYYEIDLREPLTSTLASEPTTCFDQSYHPTVPHKSVRFKEDLEIRFQLIGKEGDIYFERRQPIQDRNNSLTFSTHLMINVLGLDVSPREIFYDTYWSQPNGTNDRLDHLND